MSRVKGYAAGRAWLVLAAALGMGGFATAEEARVEIGEDISQHDALMTSLGRELELKQQELAIAQAEDQIQQIQELRGGGSAASGGVVLIGIYAGEARSYAEFAVGDAVRRVDVGAAFGDGLRLRSVGEGYVEVDGPSGKQRYYVSSVRRRAASGQR